MRPSSIVRFDRLYLAAIAIGLIANILGWGATMARLAATPQAAQLGSGGAVVAGATIALGTLISLLLWYLIAHRASTVAKWVLVVFTAFALVSLFLGLSGGAVAADAAGIARMIAVTLQLIAVIALFRPDAAQWFAPVSPEHDA